MTTAANAAAPAWHRADEEGNPQGYTYAARPDGPCAYTRPEYARVLRAACAEQASDDRRAAIARRARADRETFFRRTT